MSCRIATLMFYLSSLTGGFTAFPKLGVAARPRAGTAVFWYNLQQVQYSTVQYSTVQYSTVFWYNLLQDGQPSDLPLHGACPALLGVKWVANKWIREGAQIWRRSCPALHTGQTY